VSAGMRSAVVHGLYGDARCYYSYM